MKATALSATDRTSTYNVRMDVTVLNQGNGPAQPVTLNLKIAPFLSFTSRRAYVDLAGNAVDYAGIPAGRRRIYGIKTQITARALDWEDLTGPARGRAEIEFDEKDLWKLACPFPCLLFPSDLDTSGLGNRQGCPGNAYCFNILAVVDRENRVREQRPVGEFNNFFIKERLFIPPQTPPPLRGRGG